MKGLRFTAFLTMLISLVISVVSAYCTIVGMGKVFVSASNVAMFIAAVIELGRVMLIYDLHHFWDKMKLKQKIPGICMLLIAISLSAMGIFGYMSNAHSQRTQEIIPIEMMIEQKLQEIDVLNNKIIINNKELEQFSNNEVEKYTSMGYVTKAVKLKQQIQKQTKEIYDSNRKHQEEIDSINKEILSLKLDAEKKSPTLAHLKYYAKLFNVDDELAIVIFIVMIMLVFDTLAMYLMITSDWISSLNISNPIEKNVYKKNIEDNFQKYNPTKEIQTCIKSDINELKQLKQKSEVKQLFSSNELLNKMNENNKDIHKKLDDTINSCETWYNRIKGKFDDETVIKKLDLLEDSIKKFQNQKQETKNKKKNIDKKVNKIIDLINNDENIILSNDFRKYISEEEILNKLKDYYIDNKKIYLILSEL